jgi:Cu(I)/Ag(I) efflux system periplasmic protein CusF
MSQPRPPARGARRPPETVCGKMSHPDEGEAWLLYCLMYLPRSAWARHAVACACLVLGSFACSRSQSAAEEARRVAPASAPSAIYTTRGTVRAISGTGDSITIAHDDIPGFMKAMTMMFETKDAAQTRGLQAGERVDFTFGDYGSGRLVIERIARQTQPVER